MAKRTGECVPPQQQRPSGNKGSHNNRTKTSDDDFSHNQMENEIKKLRDDVKKYEKMLSEEKEKNNRLECEHRLALEEARRELSEERKEKNRLEEKLTNARKEIDGLLADMKQHSDDPLEKQTDSQKAKSSKAAIMEDTTLLDEVLDRQGADLKDFTEKHMTVICQHMKESKEQMSRLQQELTVFTKENKLQMLQKEWMKPINEFCSQRESFTRVEQEKAAAIGELNMEKTHSRDLEKQNERLQKAYDTLSKQYSDLTSSMKEMQQSKQCHRSAAECNRIHEEYVKWHTLMASKECKRPDCEQMRKQIISGMEQHLEQQKTDADYHRKQCEQMTRKISEMERQLEHKEIQLEKLTPMKQMAQQHGGDHDQLSIEYEELWTNPDLILGQLEQHFDDDFNSKRFLSNLFMETYKESKQHMTCLLIDSMDELYKVQKDKSKKAELEDLSRAFGLLLHSTGVKAQLILNEAVPYICEEVEKEIPRLLKSHKVKDKTKLLNTIPLRKVVEMAWKFVTQPNPVIAVTEPDTYHADLHDRYHGHWDKRQTSQPLIYVQPVVYRSYHGTVMSKGAIGNY